ncbi:MAG TPA: hypothetical protein VF691_13380 [Cytophagaceae bacterium]|jgi:hypothetical protein
MNQITSKAIGKIKSYIFRISGAEKEIQDKNIMIQNLTIKLADIDDREKELKEAEVEVEKVLEMMQKKALALNAKELFYKKVKNRKFSNN